MTVISIFGCVNDPNTFFAEDLAKKFIRDFGSDKFEIVFQFMYEVDFKTKLFELKDRIDPILMHYEHTHIVIVDNNVVGDVQDFIALARDTYNIQDAEVANTVLYNRDVRESTFKLVQDNGNPVYTLSFGIEGARGMEDLGTVHIELFAKVAPQACKNFAMLCEGSPIPGMGYSKFSYRNCPVHRLVRNGWIQTGDIVDGTGKNSVCAFGAEETVPDEAFSVDFGFQHGGIVGYANNGAHASRSQFFVTLGPNAWMNHKFQGFGRVIQGLRTIRALNRIEVSNNTPTSRVVITDCGLAPEMQK